MKAGRRSRILPLGKTWQDLAGRVLTAAGRPLVGEITRFPLASDVRFSCLRGSMRQEEA